MMLKSMFGKAWMAITIAVLLTACGGSTLLKQSEAVSPQGNEVTFYALGLIDTGYRFGGKNPEAGLDCSGMVSYVYREAVGMKIIGSAADMARRGKEIDKNSLRAGDLVFFNTLNRPFSHVGVYIGDGRFIHAPSSKGKVRIERMDNVYFAPRFEMARTYFD